MPLSWNEIKDRALRFSREWAEEASEDAEAQSFWLKPSGLLGEYPNLAAYVARGEARPAYRRAFDAQLAVFNAPQL